MKFYFGHFLLASALVTSGTSAFAAMRDGSIVLVGNGLASSAPEYLSLNIDVTSICYNTSHEAAEANAKIAQKIVTVLQSFRKGEHDLVTATGGANVRQTETTYVGRETKVLCELKWRSENHLRIDMARMEDLSDLQDKLFAELAGADVLDPNVVAQTFTEVGRPQFSLYPETSQKLRDKAQGLAFEDARTQFNGFAAHCSFADPQLISVSPPEFSMLPKRIEATGGYASASAPVIPDELEVKVTLRLEWAFTPSSSCRNVAD